MEQIGDKIKTLFGQERPVKVLKSERASIVYDFLEKLNAERVKTNITNFSRARAKNKTLTKDEFKKTKEYMKPLQASYVAFKMSHLKIADMHYLWSICKQGAEFSKVWWGALKPRDDAQVIHRRY